MDARRISRSRGLRWLAFVVIASALVPQLLTSDYQQLVLELICIYVIATAGLNVSIGFSGQFQMAQAALMALGAYTSAILTVDHGWSFAPAVLASLVVVAGFGAIVALVSLRTRSHYLLLATFGLQLIAVDVLNKLSITGGVNGHVAAAGIPFGGDVLLGSTRGYSIVLVAVAALALWSADWIKRSYVGLGFQATRQNERLVLSAGLSPGWMRFSAVLTSGLYGGIAGILMGPILTFLVPASFGLSLTLLLLLIVVVGGMGSVIGVAVAAIMLTIVNQTAQGASSAWPLIYGLTIMIVLVVAPSGLAGAGRLLLDHARRRWAGWRGRTAEPAVAPAAAELVPAGSSNGQAGSALALSELRRYYGGVKALDGVSLSVEPGTIHGLIGPNGSGKTTLFDVVCGFVSETGGNLDLTGSNLARLRAGARARAGIGRTFQLPNILLENTAIENVLLGVTADMPAHHRLRVAGGRAGVWEQRALEALDRVGLGHLRDVPMRDLPYGNQRIIDLARVLAARPSMLLLDEPGAGMSSSDRETITNIIRGLRSQGVTVVIVEHDMQLIMGVCDRITVLASGKVIAEGAPDEIAHDPAVIAAYLGEAYVAG